MIARHLTSCVAVFAVLIAAARPAASGSKTHTRWYGGQILLLDASVIAFAFAAEDGAVLALPLTGPVVHATHRRWRAAAGSAALRILVPLVGMAAGNATCLEQRGHREQNDLGLGCIGYQFWGAIAGYGIALAIDSSVLSFEERAPRPSRSATPVVQIGVSPATIGVGLTF